MHLQEYLIAEERKLMLSAVAAIHRRRARVDVCRQSHTGMHLSLRAAAALVT